MSQNAILGGIRVLDLSQYLVGPHCTLLLSGMGAEVIRIDNPRPYLSNESRIRSKSVL